MFFRNLILAALACMVWLTGCGEPARLPVEASMGPNPQLPKPETSLIPLVNVAPAKGWAAGMQPRAAAGLQVSALASGFDHPHWLYVLPNGDVLVAESNKPQAAETGFSLRQWFMKKAQAKAGAGTPSANRLTPAARCRRRRPWPSCTACVDGFFERARRSVGPPRGRGPGQARRAAGGRRRGQCGVASHRSAVRVKPTV
jgi:hypothetical protein